MCDKCTFSYFTIGCHSKEHAVPHEDIGQLAHGRTRDGKLISSIEWSAGFFDHDLSKSFSEWHIAKSKWG